MKYTMQIKWYSICVKHNILYYFRIMKSKELAFINSILTANESYFESDILLCVNEKEVISFFE